MFCGNIITSCVLALIIFSIHCCALKILVIPTVVKGHLKPMVEIIRAWEHLGHEAVVLLPEHSSLSELKNSSRVSVQYYVDTPFPGYDTADYDQLTETMMEGVLWKGEKFTDLIYKINGLVDHMCADCVYNNDIVLDKLSNMNFDLALLDGNVITGCVYLIPHRLQLPYITYTDVLDPLDAGVPWLPSFVPNAFLPLSEKMTFLQRIQNTALQAWLTYGGFSYEPDDSKLDKYRKYGQFSSLRELQRRSKFWIYTRDHILDYARPVMPNMLIIGGLSATASSGKLSADLEDFIRASPNGFILITFGSMGSRLPREIANKFINAFRHLAGYRVLWRLNNDDNLEIPDNVKLSSWLPQTDLLAHSAIKLFITHCGNSGQYESVYHGVPMIGIPLFADQPYNAVRMEHKGFGIAMNIFEFTTDELVLNIGRVINDTSYKRRVMLASRIIRSEPFSPAERAARAVEHIGLFGADHLQSAASHMPLYAYLMLDIVAAILGILTLLCGIVWLTCRVACRQCPRNVKSKSD